MSDVDSVISRPKDVVHGRQPTPALNKALAAAQKTAKAVGKDARNTFHGYNYASAEALLEEAREALSAHGLAVLPRSIDRDPTQPDHVWGKWKNPKTGEDEDIIVLPRRIRADYTLLHESGEERDFYSTVPVIPEKGRPEDKAEFGSRTENLGYALRDLLLLPRVQEGAVQPSGRDDTNDRGPRPAPLRVAPKASTANGSTPPKEQSPSATPVASGAEEPAASTSEREPTDEVECFVLKKSGSKKAHTQEMGFVSIGTKPRRTLTQNARMHALKARLGITDDEWRKRLAGWFSKETSAELSADEADEVISALEKLEKSRGDDPDKSKGKAARATEAQADIAEYLEPVREVGADDGE